MKKGFGGSLACIGLASMLLLGVILVAVAGTVSAAYEGGYTYDASGESVIITGYDGPGGAVTIPGTLGGLPVVAIGDAVFQSYGNMTSVVIPNTVASIGRDSFRDCTSLTSITFLGLIAPTVGVNWIQGIDSGIRGHAYTASNFPAPGESFQGLIMGVAIDAIAPGAPTNLIATPISTQITLEWGAPADGGSAITGYNIYRSLASGTETWYITVGNVLTYPDAGLTNGLTYYYKVSAVNSVGEGAQSIEASATPAAVPLAPVLISAAPGDAQVTLTWSAPSDGGAPITEYRIYRGMISNGEIYLTTVGVGLTYTDNAVSNGQTYYYKVSARNSWGEGLQSNERSATPSTGPSPPQNLAANAGDAEVTLTWSAPTSNGGATITNYRIYRGTTSGNEALLTTLGNVLTFTDTGLTNGQTYYYKVSAMNSVGEGQLSNEDSATPTAKPSAPLNLLATPSNARVTLVWEAPIDDGGSAITGYKVYRGTTPGGGSLIETLGPVFTHADTGVTNGLTYYYRVSAVSSVGEGPQSNEEDATPTGPPTAPRNLVASPGNAYINITWQPPANNGGSAITNYRVWRGTSSGTWTFQASVGLKLWLNDTGLINDQKYYYWVSAANALGVGPNSSEASATPSQTAIRPSAPQGLEAAAGNARVTLTWSAPTSDGGAQITNYRIYRGPTSGNEVLVTTLGNVLTFTDTGLTNGQTYYYRVSAVNSVGESDKSIGDSAIPATVPSAPRSLQAAAEEAAIRLTWAAPSYTGPGTLSYHLFRDNSLIWSGAATSYLDSSLAVGSTHAYKVAASNALGWGVNSSVVQAIPVLPGLRPTPPLNPAAVAGNGNVTLSWNAPAYSNASSVEGYLISYGIAPDSMTNQVTWDLLVIVIEDLEKGQEYYFKVSARNNAGYGLNSSIISKTPFGVPSAPVGLTATVGSGQISLNWSMPAYAGPGAMTYHLYRDGDLLWSGSSLSYNDDDVALYDLYEYKVAAQNDVGRGHNSSVVYSALLPVRPGAPTGLKAIVGDGQVTLTWGPPSQPGTVAITGYKVYRGATPGSLVLIATVSGTTYVDVDVMENPSYHYKVSAVSSAGEGAQTAVVVAVIVATTPEFIWIAIIGAAGSVVAVGAGLIYLRKK